MTKKNDEIKHANSSKAHPRDIFTPKEFVFINTPKTIMMINNPKKRVTLELLLNQDKTMMQLSKETGWNPGTIKRHISDLSRSNLITTSRIVFNNHRIKSTYYRASAKRFIFHYEWP